MKTDAVEDFPYRSDRNYSWVKTLNSIMIATNEFSHSIVFFNQPKETPCP